MHGDGFSGSGFIGVCDRVNARVSMRTCECAYECVHVECAFVYGRVGRVVVATVWRYKSVVKFVCVCARARAREIIAHLLGSEVVAIDTAFG